MATSPQSTVVVWSIDAHFVLLFRGTSLLLEPVERLSALRARRVKIPPIQ